MQQETDPDVINRIGFEDFIGLLATGRGLECTIPDSEDVTPSPESERQRREEYLEVVAGYVFLEHLTADADDVQSSIIPPSNDRSFTIADLEDLTPSPDLICMEHLDDDDQSTIICPPDDRSLSSEDLSHDEDGSDQWEEFSLGDAEDEPWRDMIDMDECTIDMDELPGIA